MDSSVDDFLSFKDFTNVHGQSSNPTQSSTGPAQINVNSPEKNTSARGRDHFQDLLYDMSKSSNILDGSVNSGAAGGSAGGNTPMFSSNPDSVTSEEEGAKTKNLSILSLEFYQQFFNVDTYMVLDRVASSIIPKRAPINYLKYNIGENPDLYGPLWITITLIFSIAISGNIASYLQHANESYHWRYNFHLVSYAATAIFIYACFLPIALWTLLKYTLKPVEDGFETENANYTPSLLSLVCVYGYSLAIYIPVSILWVIQISILQWLLVATATFLSGSALIIVLTPALRNSHISLFIIIGIMGAHFLLAAGFMLYFFHMPTVHSTVVSAAAAVVAAATTAPPAPIANVPVQLPVTPETIAANLIKQMVVTTIGSASNTTG